MNIVNKKTEETSGDIWIDITDLAAWKGHFSGIQRVVYAYAKRYYAEGAKFFIYSKTLGLFKQVDGVRYFDEIEASAVKETQNSNTTKKPQVSRKEQIRSVYRFLLPGPIRKIVTLAARILIHTAYGLLKLLPLGIFTKPLFSSDDTVLLLGAGWESGEMINQLAGLKKRSGFKVVHLWHDFLPISQPHLFDKFLIKRQTDYCRVALPLSDATVTVSQATKNDIIDFAKKENIKLTSAELIVREGEDAFSSATPTKPVQLEGHDLTGGFIFSLGTIEVRKNHQILYQAYKLAKEKGTELPKLVIAGRKGWLAQDLYYVMTRDQEVAKNILVLTNASDAEVAWLFDNCKFSVFPSLSEGWGLPICESLSHGKLCLTCNLSSMPEVAGELGDYFSPYNTQECLDLIASYADNSGKLEKKEKAIKDNYKLYTWDESYKVVRDFINELAS